jgi:hypothetical protein
MSTTAGQGLIDDINDFIAAKQAEDRQTRRDIAAARRAKDTNQEKVLDATLAELGGVLDSLKKEKNRLMAPVNWDRAETENTSLDSAMKNWYEIVTTDWKSKHDKLMVEYDTFKVRVLERCLRSDLIETAMLERLQGQIRQIIS